VRRVLATAFLACLPMLVIAQVSTGDFARGAEIRTDEGSLFRLSLPDDVYETVTRADLGDLRVLNGSGEAVPHMVRRPPHSAASPGDWSAVPSFPLSDMQPAGSARTLVKIDPSGAVLEVRGGTARRATPAYLVDVSAITDGLDLIALTSHAPPGVTFLTHVRVDASNDLNSWRTLVGSAALAQLQRDTLTLVQSEIDLPPGAGRPRYLRISWPGELSSVSLSGVRVRRRALVEETAIRWKTLAGERLGSSGEALYDAHAQLPVEYLDLDFGDAADAVDVVVMSRTALDSPWQRRHAGLFYALQQANGTVHGSPARIAAATDRYWAVQRSGSGGWTAGHVPRLKVGWHPHELVFVASGTPPYMLVYGSGRVAAADAPIGAVLASLDEAERARQVHMATLGAPHDLGGASALTAAPDRRRIMLWAVLAMAVASLAWLAVRTLRDTTRQT
jgi:hypothetical protein